MAQTNRQSGQTLIETIVSLFILTMALVAGLSLAIYAATQSTQSRDRIIATNLARESLEVIRMMRDSNWLAAEDSGSVDDLYLTNGGCAYSADPGQNRPCYPEAFRDPYNLASPTSSTNYRTMYDTSTAGWYLDAINGQENFLLCLQPDGTYQHNTNPGITCTLSSSPGPRFARRVVISTGNTAYPYTASSGNPTAAAGHSPEKVVTATVVWQGRGCTPFTTGDMDPVVFNTKCKVTMTERLTNWKDYR